MKFLNRLKTERQDLINSLNDNIEALEKLAYEQQIEIEQWKECTNKYQNLWCEALKKNEIIQTEAIKEFAEKAKMECAYIFNMKDRTTMLIALDAIEKEMVGDDNA